MTRVAQHAIQRRPLPLRPIRRQRRSGDTVRFILDAAERLCNDRVRCSAITIKQVADVAGVGVGTVYHHFEDRQSVLRAVGKRTSTQEMSKLLEQIPPPQPGHCEDFIAQAIDAVMQNAKVRIANYGSSIESEVLRHIIFDYFDSAADCTFEVISRFAGAADRPSLLVIRAAVQITGMMTWVVATQGGDALSTPEQLETTRLAVSYFERNRQRVA
jgi:AcrR family transcriptional regulator